LTTRGQTCIDGGAILDFTGETADALTQQVLS